MIILTLHCIANKIHVKIEYHIQFAFDFRVIRMLLSYTCNNLVSQNMIHKNAISYIK